jgi:hypothetical protein
MYRDSILDTFRAAVESGGPLQFSYDIGPGYHASLRPGNLDLNFSVGLSELFILSQVASFCDQVAAIYRPGARFWLVVDNLCGLRTNDIPVAVTEGYCAQLRGLIGELGLRSRVELIVESEKFDLEEYDGLLAGVHVPPSTVRPSEEEQDNVERFLGRRCSPEEALERIDLYARTTIVTEKLLAREVRGVRMTQRAGATTIGFRPFPGGDLRTQCGEVAMGRNAKGKLQPLLLTSRNLDGYACARFSYAELPVAVTGVTYADRLAA